jgi:hypothetical protein
VVRRNRAGHIADAINKWAKVIRAANIKPD